MKYLLFESMRNNESKKVHFSLQDPDVFYIYEGQYKIQNTYRIKSIAKKSAVNIYNYIKGPAEKSRQCIIHIFISSFVKYGLLNTKIGKIYCLDFADDIFCMVFVILR